jgi:hypothetical protein
VALWLSGSVYIYIYTYVRYVRTYGRTDGQTDIHTYMITYNMTLNCMIYIYRRPQTKTSMDWVPPMSGESASGGAIIGQHLLLWLLSGHRHSWRCQWAK